MGAADRVYGSGDLIAEMRHTGRMLADFLEAEADQRPTAVQEYQEATGSLQETPCNDALLCRTTGSIARYTRTRSAAGHWPRGYGTPSGWQPRQIRLHRLGRTDVA